MVQGKLEREKLVRDIEAGNAPAVDLPAAGRGRGMTMPAWMRKKMCVYLFGVGYYYLALSS